MRLACLATLWLGLSFVGSTVQAAESRELVFLTWADYISPEIVSGFERECRCRVKTVFFDSDDVRDTLMVESDGAGYDVVVLNGLMLHTYAKRGWLAPIETSAVPNAALIDQQWRTAFEAAERYGVPYFWGTLGIGYRKDLAGGPIRSWSDLMDPGEALRGRILMVDSARDLLSAALKSLGASLNSADPGVLAQARQRLLAQRPFVRSYSYVSLDAESALVTGDAVASMLFNGDARMLQQYNPEIDFVLPAEGGAIWIDYLAIAQRSGNQDLAADFIDFLNRPQIAAENAQYVHYATPNSAAETRLPRAFLDDPVIYPDNASLVNSEYFSRLPPRVERLYNEIFTAVVE
jgi:spermidine/putrescine transport system substrate-binding protein